MLITGSFGCFDLDAVWISPEITNFLDLFVPRNHLSL